MLQEFELGHHSRVNRQFKKLNIYCKNLEDQVKVPKTIEPNPARNTWRLSGERGHITVQCDSSHFWPRQKHLELLIFA